MKLFEKFLHNILNSKFKKFMVIFLVIASFFASVMMIPSKMVLARMLPGKSANTYSIYVDTPNGSSIEQTTKITECVGGYLQKESAIVNIQTFLGLGSPLDYAGLVKGSAFKNGENVAEMVINLTDKHHRDEPSFLMVQRLRPILQKNCASLLADTNIKMIEQPSGPPTLASIVVEIYGKNDENLRTLSQEVSEILKNTDGLVDVDIMNDEIYQKFQLSVNKEKILRSGLSIKQLNQILYLGFEGMTIAVKNSENSPEQIPIFLGLSDETKRVENFSKEELQNKLSSLKLMNPKGMMIPLNELVSIDVIDSKPMIMTKNLKKMTNILAETVMVSQVYPLLDGRDKIKEKLSNKYEIQNSYLFDYTLTDKKTGEVFQLVWDGEMKVSLDTFKELGVAFISALILIFLLLVIYYKSFVLSGMVLLGSFLSIIGVIVGHYIMDIFTAQTFFLTATSLIGFIALMGISSRNSLLLIDFTISLIIDTKVPKRKAIALATATRAKPILLTGFAIILASTLLAGDPVFGGLGVALIFGTIAAVIVSLIFIPVLMDNSKIMELENLTKLKN